MYLCHFYLSCGLVAVLRQSVILLAAVLLARLSQPVVDTCVVRVTAEEGRCGVLLLHPTPCEEGGVTGE